MYVSLYKHTCFLSGNTCKTCGFFSKSILVVEMERIGGCMKMMRLCFVLLLYFTQCDATRSMRLPRGPISSLLQHIDESTSSSSSNSIIKPTKKLKFVNKNLDHVIDPSLDSSNYPSFGALSPVSLLEISPPFCVYPPSPPSSTATPTPIVGGDTPYIPPFLPLPTPPPSPMGLIPGPPSPPDTFPSPIGNIPSPPDTFPSPIGNVPGPPDTFPSPIGNVPGPPDTFPSPSYSFPGPPSGLPGSPGFGPTPAIPGPPYYEPSPPSLIPSPPVFEPPVVYPPPTGPPPPKRNPGMTLWCVAKPSVPDPIIQEAMNYACGSGADCDAIQPSGLCFQPDTLYAHASYAFNSYWQRTKVAGGTCDFGGTAMLVTLDPSYNGCHFLYY